MDFKVCHRFIFLLFPCLNNRPVNTDRKNARNVFLKDKLLFCKLFLVYEENMLKPEDRGYHLGVIPSIFRLQQAQPTYAQANEEL